MRALQGETGVFHSLQWLTRTPCFLHELQELALARGITRRRREFTSSDGQFAVLSPSATGQQHSCVLRSTLVLWLSVPHSSACLCNMCILPDVCLQASCLSASSLALSLPLPRTTCILHVNPCPTCLGCIGQLPPNYMKCHLQADKFQGTSQMSTSIRSIDMRSTLRRDASNAGALAERQTLPRGQSNAAQLPAAAAATAGSPLQRGRSDAAMRAEAFACELQQGQSTPHIADKSTLDAEASETAVAGQQEPAVPAASGRVSIGEGSTSQEGIGRPQKRLTARRSFSRGAIEQAEALAQTLQRGRSDAAASAGEEAEEPAASPGLQQGRHSAAKAAALSSTGKLGLDDRAALSGAPLQRGRSSVAEAEAFLTALKLQRGRSNAGGPAAEMLAGDRNMDEVQRVDGTSVLPVWRTAP